MTKKIITIFFLTVFIVQFLPIRQVGNLIAGATMTEELPESGTSKASAGFNDMKWFLITSNHPENNVLNNGGQSQYIHYSDTLPSQLLSDVQSPPPNIFC